MVQVAHVARVQGVAPLAQGRHTRITLRIPELSGTGPGSMGAHGGQDPGIDEVTGELEGAASLLLLRSVAIELRAMDGGRLTPLEPTEGDQMKRRCVLTRALTDLPQPKARPLPTACRHRLGLLCILALLGAGSVGCRPSPVSSVTPTSGSLTSTRSRATPRVRVPVRRTPADVDDAAVKPERSVGAWGQAKDGADCLDLRYRSPIRRFAHGGEVHETPDRAAPPKAQDRRPDPPRPKSSTVPCK